MKKSLILLLSVLLIFISGCGNNDPKESNVLTKSEAESTVVYLTKTGECYHRSKCTCLNRSKIKKKLSQVVNNYRPCQLCYPPIIEE